LSKDKEELIQEHTETITQLKLTIDQLAQNQIAVVDKSSTLDSELSHSKTLFEQSSTKLPHLVNRIDTPEKDLAIEKSNFAETNESNVTPLDKINKF